MKQVKTLGIVILSLTFFLINPVTSFSAERDDLYKELEIFAEGLATIEEKYVEDKTAHDLIYGAMSGMLMSLDSYSQFLNPEDYQNLIVETEGKFGGLGIEITIRDGLLTIISPMEDTPAWDAGIEAGDIIVKIEGELTKGIKLHEAVGKLRGDPGSDVTITITSGISGISLIHRKPSILLGKNGLYSKGATYDLDKKENLGALIEKALREGFTSDKQKMLIEYAARTIKYYSFSFGRDIEKYIGRGVEEAAQFLVDYLHEEKREKMYI